MIKFQEIQKGDFVIAEYDGERRRGEVTNLQRESKRAMVDNGIQEFWYEENQLHPLPLNDEELTGLRFQKQQNEDGTVKYMKGAFRMMIASPDDFSRLEIWYRDEKRHIAQPLNLHQLQNHFYEMTKVHLNSESFE